jgi:hypothetical protein
VRLWDTREGKQLAALRVGAPALSVAFSPDGRLLAAGDYRGGLRVWKVAGLWGGEKERGESDAKGR